MEAETGFMGAGAKELTADEIDRLEWLLGVIHAKRLVGEALSETEGAIAVALEDLTGVEREAREAFGAFCAGLSPPVVSPVAGANADDALPADVALAIGRWVACRRTWDVAVTAFLEAMPTPSSDTLVVHPTRTGPRLRASLPASLRIPTALPARDTLALLFAPRLWKADVGGGAILAEHGDTQLRLECDEALGLGPEQAIRQIARHGASAAQTFFALVGLWLERNANAPSHEVYMDACASDLLRYQRRRETPRGGYHAEDVQAKGRDVYLLSRISIPRASVLSYASGRREMSALSLGRLLSVEALDVRQDATETGGALSAVQFRYHLGREVYEWVGGSQPQYARLSGAILTYHPIRQKYQILLGFCLAYYDRVNRKNRQEERRIRLPALFNLAAVEVPAKRISEFLETIEQALEDLARDGVIPGLRLQKPAGWPSMLARRDARGVLAGSVVTFPRLDSAARLNPGAAVPDDDSSPAVSRK